MSAKAVVRSLLPNVTLTIPHVEPATRMRVRLRHHAGLVLRGAASYEPQYVRVFRVLVEPGATVLDIGANIGFYTLLFSRLAGRDGAVLAYEPDPDNLALLQANVSANACGNTTIRAVALAADAGVRPFSRDLVTGFTGRLGSAVTYGETLAGSDRVVLTQVVTQTLDDDVAARALRPSVIKLDVEGFEHEVLSGGRETLRSYRPLIVAELSADFGSSSNPSTTTLLHDCGYRVWDLDTGAPVAGGERAWMVLGLPEELPHQRAATVLAALPGARQP